MAVVAIRKPMELSASTKMVAAKQYPKLMPVVRRWLTSFERSASKALAARAKHIRARLSPM